VILSSTLTLRSSRVVLPDGIRPAAVRVENGRIAAIRAPQDVPQGEEVVDVGASVIMPGLVDTHVHINEPGRTQWEGFETATRAAAAGGITTLVDMPLNSIPATTSVAALEMKRAAAAGKCAVDVHFWGGVVPGMTDSLRSLYHAGALGFKCFLVPSGVDEFPHVTEADLRQAMPVLAELGVVLLVHAELPEELRGARGNPRQYPAYLASRPRKAEDAAIDLMVDLCREFRTPVHIVHLSSSDALPSIEQARQEGLPLTVETCPHYLFFEAESIPVGATEYKCAPPIREAENRERLWAALGTGLIDMVVTDHSPCVPEMKQAASGDFMKAWGGIASLECSLSAVWTAARKRGYGIDRVAQWMSERPARLAGLDGRKGRIAVGYDADLVVWDPEGRWLCRAARLRQRHKITPYDGMELDGVIQAVYSHGQQVL